MGGEVVFAMLYLTSISVVLLGYGDASRGNLRKDSSCAQSKNRKLEKR